MNESKWSFLFVCLYAVHLTVASTLDGLQTVGEQCFLWGRALAEEKSGYKSLNENRAISKYNWFNFQNLAFT